MKKVKSNKPKLKRFIIRKYVMTQSAVEAIKNERKHKPDDVWLDDKQPESDLI